jgi:hypothetical protein
MPTKRAWIIMGVCGLAAVGIVQNASQSRQMRGGMMPAQYQMQGQYPQSMGQQGGMDESALAAQVLQQGAAARAMAGSMVNNRLAQFNMAPMNVPGALMPQPYDNGNQAAIGQIMRNDVTVDDGRQVQVGPNGNYYWMDNQGNIANTAGPLSPGPQYNSMGQGRW